MEEIELTIERFGINGEGVARASDGRTVFVEGALPGEKVSCLIVENRKSYLRAHVKKHHEISSHRQNPVCPLFGRCGGCQLMHFDYTEQLEMKRGRIQDAIQRIGKIADVTVLPCVASPRVLHYRNKIQLPVGDKMTLGLYASGSHNLIPIDRCYIHCELGEQVFQRLGQVLPKYFSTIHIKHVLIKTAVNMQQVLVILITPTSKPLPLSLAEELMKGIPQMRGVIQNINPSTNNVILGGQSQIVAGQGWIEERFHDLFFKVSPASFMQVNVLQAEQLYQQVIEYASPRREETILDAYCGIGTLSLLLAKHAGKVIGVECVPQAISDAQENALRNGIANVEFICAQAEQYIGTLAATVDVAILNPPRKGCDPEFLQALVKLAPHRIIYVSCDPATLARDMKWLTDTGYLLDILHPFDMFPQTAHVECIAVLRLP